MSENTTLHTFPRTRSEALAFLFVQSQDLTGRTPEELVDLYAEAYERIRKHERQGKPETQTFSF